MKYCLDRQVIYILAGNLTTKYGTYIQASQAALRDHTVYCATKAALDMTSKVMALELGPHKVSKPTSLHHFICLAAKLKMYFCI